MTSKIKAPHEQHTSVAPQKRESDTEETGVNVVETHEAKEEVPTRTGSLVRSAGSLGLRLAMAISPSRERSSTEPISRRYMRLPIDAAIQSNLRETTTRVLASLTPREERIVRMRFGLGMNSDHTLEEVGQQFSVTRERIRQIEAKALRKLKHPSRSSMLRSFLDR